MRPLTPQPPSRSTLSTSRPLPSPPLASRHPSSVPQLTPLGDVSALGAGTASSPSVPFMSGVPSGYFASASDDLWANIETLQAHHCSDAILIEPEHVPKTFLGPSVTLEITTGICALVLDEEALPEKKLVLACEKPYVAIDVDPAELRTKTVSPLIYQTRACAVEKIFGTPSETVLYVFDEHKRFDPLAMSKEVLRNLTAAINAETAYAVPAMAERAELVKGRLLANKHRFDFKGPAADAAAAAGTATAAAAAGTVVAP